ncbi:MAG: carboxypeptidase regulatory-like domain-containing protein [Dehalococcoidia bacterium]|nr:carboxypeptidase regulatory-like domain-containing protein [Dehalococcoidia bacterium]
MTFDEFNVVFAQEVLVAPNSSQGCPGDWFEPEPTRAQPSTQVCRTIHGVVTDLAGNPRADVGVGAIRGVPASEDGWRDATQQTGSDGAFSLSVHSGRYLLSVSPGPRAGFLYHHDGLTLTPNRKATTLVDASDGDHGPMVIAYGRLAGTIVEESGGAAAGVTVSLFRGQSSRFEPVLGSFEFFTARDTYKLQILCGMRPLGWYGGDEGFVRFESQATPIVMEDADRTDIKITLPSSVRCE